MGNWHCVTSDCATVHYLDYEGGKIRWRYGSEPWQEIQGDDYSVKRETGKCYDVSYRIGGQALEMPRPSFGKPCKNPTQWQLANNFLGKIVSISFYLATKRPIQAYVTTESINGIRASSWHYLYWTIGQLSGTSAYMYYAPTCDESNHVFAVSGVNNWQAKRVDNQLDNCGDCTLEVLKNGQVVYTETRAVCPEVEKIPCQLSTVNKQIEIEKLPYLDRVEVVDYAYDVRLGLLVDIGNYGLLLQKKPILPECLNIYNNSITSTIPTDFGNVANTPENGYRQIAQICSAPGCPPPEYQVICDCNNCESCPGDTCPVECGEQICCYNDYGVSIKEISSSNYCGGQL
jgi:hypothetical protein